MNDILVQIRVAPLDCYSCGAETKMIASICLSTGDDKVDCSITDFSSYPELAAEVASSLIGRAEIGAVKTRFSRMMNWLYMSNGCAHCDALFGEHYEIHSRYDEVVAAEFRTSSSGWRDIFSALLTSDDGHLL